MKKAKIFLLATILTGTIFAFTGCGAKKLDLNEYVNIEFEGYDGYGNAVANIDYDKLEKDLDSMDLDDLAGIGAFNVEMMAEGNLDKTDGLSNGDEVKYVWNINADSANDIKEQLNVKLKYKDVSKTVEGLKDPKDFSVKDVIDISVSGISPQGQIIVIPKIEDVTIDIDKNTNLRNGEELNITIKPASTDMTIEDVCKENNVPIFDPHYKYTVDGLSQYVQNPDEIPDDILDVMKKKGEDIILSVQKPNCECDGGWMDPYVTHENFDSYKLIGVGVMDAGDSSTGNTTLIYELHYSVHGDVTTYYTVQFNWIQDTNEGITASDISGYDHYSSCTVDEKIYGGSLSLDELKENVESYSDGGKFVMKEL